VFHRKAHFGLTSLCENCSERQLKIKKRQHGCSKPSSSVLVPDSKPKSHSHFHDPKPHTYSSLLQNALFLLQMTNGIPERPIKNHAINIVQKTSFSCLKALGISESQVLDEDDTFFELKSPVVMRDFAEAVAVKERRSILAASTSFADEDWDPFTNKKRKTSNGDHISGTDSL
jgi:hypothetical protein